MKWYLKNQITGYGIESVEHMEAMQELARMMAAHINNNEAILIQIIPSARTITISESPEVAW